jgi:hypothetical protein
MAPVGATRLITAVSSAPGGPPAGDHSDGVIQLLDEKGLLKVKTVALAEFGAIVQAASNRPQR